MSEKTRLKKDHDPEFIVQAAKLVLVEKISISAAAKDLGIPVNSLHTWVQKFRKGIWSLGEAINGNASGAKTLSPK